MGTFPVGRSYNMVLPILFFPFRIPVSVYGFLFLIPFL